MGDDLTAGEQFELMPALAEARAAAAAATQRVSAKEKGSAVELAATLPIARILVDVPLAHLDRPFDYVVPAKFSDQVVPGSRVKVRFAGQDVDGFVLERLEASEHGGRLMPIRRAVSAEPVLSPEIAALSELVAARYAGTRSDVLRLAVPPRHAATEKEAAKAIATTDPTADYSPDSVWEQYPDGPALLGRLRTRAAPRAVWSVLPGEDWARGLAQAAAATLSGGRGVVLCVPDHRDLVLLDRALTEALGSGRHVTLAAGQGPSARYRSFLSIARGTIRVVAGTRSAAFAPVLDLGLVAIWDDGDDLYAEPRAPYPNTREVLLLRAHQSGSAALLGGVARSVEASALVASGWATEVTATREQVRAAAPRVSVTGATDLELERDPFARTSRLPSSAFAAIREALARGPVLVQTPREGYAATLVCEDCRAPARCPVCSGPLLQSQMHLPPSCRWCGVEDLHHACATCGGRGLRAPQRGALRTVEELGKAFPNVPIVRSSGDRVLSEVSGKPALVVATPGAEPLTEGGYAAVVLLDTWLMLSRPEMRAEEECVRRWFNAAALARGGSEEGRVVVVGDPAEPTLQALVRWDPAGFAERESAQRHETHLPPASRLAVLSGGADAVNAAAASLDLPDGAEVLGPVALTDEATRAASAGAGDTGEAQIRLVVRVPRSSGPALSKTLVAMQGV